jgi:hypothetical protein
VPLGFAISRAIKEKVYDLEKKNVDLVTKVYELSLKINMIMTNLNVVV